MLCTGFVDSDLNVQYRDLRSYMASVGEWEIFIHSIADLARPRHSSSDGTPAIKAGQYVLKNHGRIVRPLSLAEYTSLRAQVIRGFSGYWMVFYFLGFAYFAFCGSGGRFNGRIRN